MEKKIEKGPTGRIKGLRELLIGMTREDVLGVLPDFSLDDVAPFGYIESTDFDLLHTGKRYPPKAVLGLASQRVVGRPLTSDEFSGGEGSACFAALRERGFDIERKAASSSAASGVGVLERLKQYDREAIAGTFEPGAKFTRGAGRWGMPGIVETPKDSGNFVFMVTLDVLSETNPYQDALTEDGYLIWESQTQQSFESKAIQKCLAHDPRERNIHLFLRPNAGMDYTYLGLLGYFSHDENKTKPVHFVWRVQNWDLTPKDLAPLSLPLLPPLDPAYSPATPAPATQTLVRVDAPAKVSKPGAEKKQGRRSSKAGTVDWAERDLRNRQLGLLGEKLVLKTEMDALHAAGRADLAEQVEHVALVNSAAGYDIRSFRPDGSVKRIEVKTTQGPASAPFFISLNEILESREDPASYSIYRVFDCQPEGIVKYFELIGDVETSCGLEAVNFRAYPGRQAE